MNALQDSDATAMLFLAEARRLVPLNPIALTRGQATRRELALQYKDAYVIERTGAVYKIEAVRPIAPWGESLGRRLISRLTSAWKLDVTLSERLEWPLDAIKNVAVSALETTEGWSTLVHEPREALTARIMAATDAAGVFAALRLPPPDEALDVL